MKICERNLRTFAVIISTVLLLLLSAQSDSMESERLDPVTAWRPSPTSVRISKEITAYRSALSKEESCAFYLLHTVIVIPEKAVASDRGRLLELSEDKRRLIGDHLKGVLGSKLVPEEAVAYLGAYERQEGARTVRRFQLSYQCGTLRVAIGGKLDEFIPNGITVLLAEPGQAPRADHYVSIVSTAKEYSIAEIVEVESGVERQFKITLLHYE